MLELGGEVGGDVARRRAAVGHDQDLGRPRDAVHAHRAEHLALGERDVDVARPHQHVDTRDGGGPVGQRRDRLGAAQAVDGVDAGDLGGGQDGRGHGAVGSGRGRQHDLRDSRHPGRDGAHEHRRRVGGPPSGRVDPRPPHRPGQELQARRPHRLGVELGLVEGADAVRRQLQRGAVPRLEPAEGASQLGCPQLEAIARRRLPAVEAFLVLAQGRVAFGRHAGDDLLYRGPLLGKPGEVKAPAAERAVQPGAEVEALKAHRALLPRPALA